MKFSKCPAGKLGESLLAPRHIEDTITPITPNKAHVNKPVIVILPS